MRIVARHEMPSELTADKRTSGTGRLIPVACRNNSLPWAGGAPLGPRDHALS
jgi:hypothetical protein